MPKEEINNGTKVKTTKRLSMLEQALQYNVSSKHQLETISPNNNPKEEINNGTTVKPKECFIEEETEEAGIIEPQYMKKRELVYEVVKKLDNELIDPKDILTISNPLHVYENSKIFVLNNETYKPAVYIEPINPYEYSVLVKETNPIIANINNIITPDDKKINNDYINNIIPLVDEKINNEINNDCLLFFGLDPIKHNRDCDILLQFYKNADITLSKKYSDASLALNDQKSTDEQDKISLIKKEDIIEYLQNIKRITKKIIRHTDISKKAEIIHLTQDTKQITSHTVNTKKTEIIHLAQDTMSDTLKNMIKFPKTFLKTDSGINLYTETLKSEFIDYLLKIKFINYLKKQEQCYTNSY